MKWSDDALTASRSVAFARSVGIVAVISIFSFSSPPSPACALNTPEEINTVRVYKKMSAATVLITSAYASSHHVNQDLGKGIGSGVLIDDQGLIATNAHVVQGAAKLTVTLHDGARLPAELIGSDMVSDVALLRVAVQKGKYPHAHLGNSDKLEVGQKVIAIGHPFGLGYAMSTGIISGFGKLWETKQEVFQDRIIQTTTPINPGNSGGPLVDSDDRVIGLNTAILMGAQNIGFAIPINTVKTVMGELQASGRIIRPWLGVKGKFVTEELRTLIALPIVDGLMVQDVEEGSPAAKIGLQAGELDVAIEGEPWVLGGDILVSVDGQDVKSVGQYTKVLQGLKADQTIELRVFRDGDYRTVSAKLGERPTPPLPQQRAKTDVPPLIPQVLPYSQF
ncbi:putative Serine/cysteine peptidase, trypsin-like [Nitrospira sp. KM1]|uniref:S1C family serine protease n=1 Tax=Nitrospira sp. KM1 TaxID=1936990 RepID=UPI0013A796B7|nr:trypsin-like peptidase domain-containing protein [Nitrospira sp. KM1]BCA56805.1 putative Serine/cysteine peptidase, trypsin-like [Nitrospira sp. KM1]